jgi:hypothetical protein
MTWEQRRNSTGALSIQPFEGTRWFGRAIAFWVLNRNPVPCRSDVAIQQLIFDMAVALPNSSTRSVPRVSGFVQTRIAESEAREHLFGPEPPGQSWCVCSPFTSPISRHKPSKSSDWDWAVIGGPVSITEPPALWHGLNRDRLWEGVSIYQQERRRCRQ